VLKSGTKTGFLQVGPQMTMRKRVISSVLDRFVRRGRPITVAGTKWRWMCGNGGNVVAYSEHGERRCAGAWAIKGITPDEFDRGKYKITSSGMVKPSDVAKWLLCAQSH